jgi:hypothetical protein
MCKDSLIFHFKRLINPLISDIMFFKKIFYYFFGHFKKGSDEYGMQLIYRFVAIWLSLIFFSFALYFVTENEGFLLLWIALFAVYSRYGDFHEEVKNNLNMITSRNRTAYIIYFIARIIGFSLIILSFLIWVFNHFCQ